MSENLLTNLDDQNTAQDMSRRSHRAENRAARRENAPWVGGLVLITIGAIFLLQNTGFLYLQNWWALFILIPAIGSFSTAYALYRSNEHRLTSAVRGSLFGGVVFSMLAFAFLFGVNFSIFLPLLLIVIGVGLLLNFVLPN